MDCTNLLSGYYVCVAVPGATTTPPTKTTKTTSKAGNGIATPTPTQSGMVSNCNKFDLVQSGDTCGNIASKHNIPLAEFYSWNPAVGSDCSALWAGYYVCVDITTYKPTTTTSTGNGIATPTPYEPGMVNNCDKFCKYISTPSGALDIAKLSYLVYRQGKIWRCLRCHRQEPGCYDQEHRDMEPNGWI